MGYTLQRLKRRQIQRQTHKMMKMINLMLLVTVVTVQPARRNIPGYEHVKDIMKNAARVSRETEAEKSQESQRFSRQAQNLPLMPYRFGYAVQDDEGSDFNQQEQSNGETITGQYSVLLPDGRIQTVSYSVAPDTGFVAEVSYSGGAGGVVIDGGFGK